MKNLPDQDFRFIAVDVETANPNDFSICQIGLAGVTKDGQIITTGTLIDPEEEFDPAFESVHGITEDKVQGVPTFDEIYHVLRKQLQDRPLIQHSNFDQTALNMACHVYELPKIQADWFDSVKIARRAWPDFKGDGGHGLANLKAKLGLDFKHHDAEEDARAAAQVVLLAEEHTGKPYRKILAARNHQSSRGYRQYFQGNVSTEGNPNGPLHGHVACFTGQISLSRSDAAKIAADAGITIKAGVSKKVNLLIVGDQDLDLLAGHSKSSKHRRAEELIEQGHEIRIIGETEFLALLKQT